MILFTQSYFDGALMGGATLIAYSSFANSRRQFDEAVAALAKTAGIITKVAEQTTKQQDRLDEQLGLAGKTNVEIASQIRQLQEAAEKATKSEEDLKKENQLLDKRLNLLMGALKRLDSGDGPVSKLLGKMSNLKKTGTQIKDAAAEVKEGGEALDKENDEFGDLNTELDGILDDIGSNIQKRILQLQKEAKSAENLNVIDEKIIAHTQELKALEKKLETIREQIKKEGKSLQSIIKEAKTILEQLDQKLEPAPSRRSPRRKGSTVP